MTDWRPMETLPTRDAEFMFWLDWSEDCAPPNPPMDQYDHRCRLVIGKAQCWGSNYQAVAWALVPAPPPIWEL
jgi:hypothetical protein